MTNFDRFFFMTIEYGLTRDAFFVLPPKFNGMPRVKAEKRYITSDGTHFGQTMYNVRMGITHVSPKQKERLEAIGFYSPRISLLQRAIMFKEREKLLAHNGDGGDCVRQTP